MCLGWGGGRFKVSGMGGGVKLSGMWRVQVVWDG